MKKTEIVTKTVCDICLSTGKEIEAIDISQPSKRDICFEHQKALLKEVRYPAEMGGEMSGFKMAVDDGYSPIMVIKFKENTNA